MRDWGIRRGRTTGIALLLWLAGAGTVAAQVDTTKPNRGDTLRVERQDSLARVAVLRQAHQIKIEEVAAVIGGVALLTVVDEPVQRWMQRHRSNTAGDVATVFRQEGEPIYYAGVSLGVLATGVVIGDADVQRAGGRMVASLAVAGAAMEALKLGVGRSRPNEGVGAFSFHPFKALSDSTGLEARGSFPSGHTTAAFAIATSLADDIDSPVASVLLYTFATGTAFSRVYDNRHWVSDTFFGAALGITTAKLVSGRWRIFNLKPPGFLVTPTGAPTLSWRVPFRLREPG